jgi:DNA-binding CsgD family transcriptional regulator
MPEELTEVIHRLDKLLNIVTAGLLVGKTQREQIKLLSKAGLPPREIADAIGTTANTVRVELAAMRKSEKKGGKKK